MSADLPEKKPLRISDLQGKPIRRIHARFDSAETTDNNRRHWARADSLSPDAATNASIRHILRNRCRYEVTNNSYARGIVLTIANDTVGTGPRLQLLTPDDGFNRTVENDFHLWCVAVELAQKLRTMRMARTQDGESFAILATNPRVDHPVQLDLKPIEAEQVASPFGNILLNDEVDGIKLDRYGNPLAYRVLRNHPGDLKFIDLNDSLTVPAQAMIHIFRADRPGQHRGTPEIAPAVELFAQLRRFTLAVLSAAEAAADFAGILYTDAPPGGEADTVEPMDKIELVRNMLLTLPGGWKMGQVEPQQPATTYAEFKHEILNEIARCLNIPYNIAACNSSGYNYASGRLDHQVYYKSIRVDQAFMGTRILDRIFRAWLYEYAVSLGYNPSGQMVDALLYSRAVRLPPHQWFWDGMEHVDPAKEANAQETRLKNHTTTLANEYARQGRDWESELRQRGREVALMKQLGLSESDVKPRPKNTDSAVSDSMD